LSGVTSRTSLKPTTILLLSTDATLFIRLTIDRLSVSLFSRALMTHSRQLASITVGMGSRAPLRPREHSSADTLNGSWSTVVYSTYCRLRFTISTQSHSSSSTNTRKQHTRILDVTRGVESWNDVRWTLFHLQQMVKIIKITTSNLNTQ